MTKMRRYDPFGFLPSWHFFAPNPARFDTVILYRDVSVASPPGQWLPVTAIYDEEWWFSIVNPSRRYHKSCHDLQNSIGNMITGNEKSKIAQSSPVKALQSVVMSNVKIAPGAMVQFCIVRILDGRRDNPKAEPVFISEPFAMH
ncbi:MAG: hypothetical protein F6K46_36105 [Moorea sp. SIO3E8]|nr:hypothetical protein [Moorena sp. SIO3E8]